MKLDRVRAETRFEKMICPYCYAKLGIREMIEKKIKRVYRCPKCNRVVDDRYVIQ